MEPIRVNSWDELLERGVDCLIGSVRPEQLVFGDGLVFEIRITGDSWGGAIDYRGANFILDMQRVVNDMYFQLSGADKKPRDLSRDLTVKVIVQEGSTWFKFDCTPALEKMAEKLGSKGVIFIAAMVITASVGCYVYDRCATRSEKLAEIQAKKEVQMIDAAARAEMEKALSEAMRRSMSIAEKIDAEKPVRGIVNRLEEDDKIAFMDGKQLTVDEAKSRYPRKPKTDKQSGVFDSAYRIMNIDLTKEPPVFRLYKDGLKIDAVSNLEGPDLDRLADGLRNAMDTHSEFHADLQVHITYTERAIVSAAIHKIGGKREGSGDIQLLVQKW